MVLANPTCQRFRVWGLVGFNPKPQTLNHPSLELPAILWSEKSRPMSSKHAVANFSLHLPSVEQSGLSAPLPLKIGFPKP